MSITTEKLEELDKKAHEVLKNKVSMDIDTFYHFIDLLIDESKKREPNNIINTVDEIRDHAHRMYSGFYDILKSKGMTDEEIDKTNLHLHLNSIGAKSACIRSIIGIKKENDIYENEKYNI